MNNIPSNLAFNPASGADFWSRILGGSQAAALPQSNPFVSQGTSGLPSAYHPINITNPLQLVLELIQQSLTAIAQAINQLGTALGIGSPKPAEGNMLPGVPPQQLPRDYAPGQVRKKDDGFLTNIIKSAPGLIKKAGSWLYDNLLGSSSSNGAATPGILEKALTWGKSAWDTVKNMASSAVSWIGSLF